MCGVSGKSRIEVKKLLKELKPIICRLSWVLRGEESSCYLTMELSRFGLSFLGLTCCHLFVFPLLYIFENYLNMRLKEIQVRWLGIPVVALISMLADSEHMSGSPWIKVYFISFCFTAVYWNGACLVIFYFRRKFPEISYTNKRLLFSAIAIIFWMTVGGIPLRLIFGITTISDLFIPREHMSYFPFNFIAATVITLSYEAFYFFDKWKMTIQQNEALKNRQIRTQYEVLQNQMSPHFLFNSLNTLTTIIPENPEHAVVFTEKLSDVYRYILQNKDRELVPLAEELEFVKSYLFLLQIRYPDNLTFDFNIEKKYLNLSMPPLTLQMLAENAIKHNIVSKAKPLHIDIYIENGRSVVVKNNLQRKDSLDKSTKTGLDNIRKRYAILGGKEIDIITSANRFMVAVPLIDLIEEST